MELAIRGLKVKSEEQVKVKYKEREVGHYEPDLLVNDCVLVELKIAPEIDKRDESQLLNAMKATGLKVGLLINFGRTKAEIRRRIF